MKGKRIFIICMIIISSIVVLTAYYLCSNHTEQNFLEADRDLRENNRDYQEFIESEINELTVLVESHGRIFSNNGLLPIPKLAEIFNLVNEKEDVVSSMYFLYEIDGSGVNSEGYINIDEIGSDLRNREWYLNAANSNSVVVSDVYDDNNEGEPVITVSYAVRNNGSLQGVLAIDVYLETLYDCLEEISTWRNTYNYVIDSKGTILLHRSRELLGISFTKIAEDQLKELNITEEYYNENYLRVWNEIISVSDTGEVNFINFMNNEEFGVFNTIDELNWTVVSAYDYDKINSGNLKYVLLLVTGAIITIIGLGAIFYYFLVWSYLRDLTTKTYNIKKIEEVIKNRSKKEKNFILLYIDLKNLTSLNSRFGLNGGDEVLLKFSKLLKSLVKHRGILASTKKKNFILVFDDNNWEKASEFTLKLNSKINELEVIVNKETLAIEAFIGLSSIHFDDKNEIQQEIEAVEEIFIELKRTELESPLIYSDFNELIEAKSAEIQLKDELLNALKEDRIVPFFQPIYNIKTKTANKYEVLMRIKKGDKFLSPYPYILIAEKYNLISNVDYTVITKALEYKKNNDMNDEIQLSINISGKLIRDKEFLVKVVNKVDELNIRHSNITFEITETYNIDELTHLKEVVEEFRNKGFKFAIDDFGSGYSSMSYLKNIGANYLKIDGSFIKDINTNEESFHVVEAIINMAKAFKTETVAEFIENQEIDEILKNMDIDYGQGYFFGKPKEGFISNK